MEEKNIKSISAHGLLFTVEKILAMDSWQMNVPERAGVDIEFRDENGKYHHYRSELDYGEMIMKDGTKYSFSKNGMMVTEPYVNVEKLTDIDPDELGDAIYNAVAIDEGNSSYEIGKSVINELMSFDNEDEFRGMDKMMIAITGYSIKSILKRCGEYIDDEIRNEQQKVKKTY